MEKFFTDTSWRPFAPDLTKKIGAFPNQIHFNSGEKTAAVVAFRGMHETWALNQAAVEYLAQAACDGRITAGFVVLAQAAGKPPEVVAWKRVEEVVALLGTVPPRDGTFGKYWWVSESFETNQGRVLTEAPF